MALCAWHGAGTCDDTTCSRVAVQHAESALEYAMTCGVGRTSFHLQAHAYIATTLTHAALPTKRCCWCHARPTLLYFTPLRDISAALGEAWDGGRVTAVRCGQSCLRVSIAVS